jgi:D-threonate/D-erythronate kinase
MQRKIAVIADDLTGANDTGVQFSKQGLKTVVLMDSSRPLTNCEEDVIVVDTQSRALPADEAYKKAAESAELFRHDLFAAVYKKVDSTLRGNLGCEIDAIMDTCGQSFAIVAPAFPKNGRITVGGYHLLEGVPLEATEISRDPKCPVSESHLPTLMREQSKRKVGHIGIRSIIAGMRAIHDEILKMLNSGHQLLVCDVWNDSHFKMIAAAAQLVGKPVLWVGSAGLAECLPGILGLAGTQANAGPVVVLAGSVSNITRLQIARLKQRQGVFYIEADPSVVMQKEMSDPEVWRCCHEAEKALKGGYDVIIATGFCDDIVEKTKKRGMELGLSGLLVAEEVAKFLGEICRKLAMELKIGGLVLTGGDIAVSCCQSLAASGINVIDEVAPGIPLGILRGGHCAGMRVVTKAGAFGAEDALSKAVDRLKT